MSTDVKSDARLSLVTFNIRYATPHDGVHYWEYRKDLAVRVVRDLSPDILGVQEALESQNRDLSLALPEYGRLGVGRDDGDSLGEHCSIFYRDSLLRVVESGTFWFSDTPHVIASKHWGNRITRICTWAQFEMKLTQQRFYVYNLHIDHESQPSRERSVGLLFDQIRQRVGGDPVFVMGDFNAEEANPAIQLMQAQGDIPLVETFRAFAPNETAVATYHGYTGAVEGDKIDYIFAPPLFEVEEARIVRAHEEDLYPSDHFPVLVSGHFKAE